MKSTTKSIAIIGYGQLGEQLASRHLADKHCVFSVSRTEIADLTPLHHHICANLDSITTQLQLPEQLDCLYYLAPPSDSDLTDERLKNFLNLHTDLSIKQLIYISTSGIYGDSKGNWIDESWPAAPQADRSKRRLEAEKQLACYQKQKTVSVTILRCAAIYSAKTVNKQRIAANKKPVITPEQAPYTNRIHLYDLTEVCWQIFQQKPSGFEIFNVSDGNPSTTTEHTWLLADMAGVKRNPVIEMSEAEQYYSPAYMSYLRESKKLDISKLKKIINPQFNYENIIDAIKECLNLNKAD